MRALVAVVLVLVLALPATAASPRRAALKLESLAPLVVTGRSFGAREPVVLTYLAADLTTRRVRVLRATRAGSFRSGFGIAVGRCEAFSVRAVGLHGTRAVLQVDPRCKRDGPPKRAVAPATG